MVGARRKLHTSSGQSAIVPTPEEYGKAVLRQATKKACLSDSQSQKRGKKFRFLREKELEEPAETGNSGIRDERSPQNWAARRFRCSR